MFARTAPTLDGADVAGFIGRYHDRNALNYWRAVRQLYRFAVRREWIERDPTACMDPPPLPRAVPSTLDPGQVAALLAAADARIVPWLAVQAFAGLRPGEAAALDWSAVDLPGRAVLVLPDTSKVRRARYVPICDRLAATLAPVARAEGRVVAGKTTREELKVQACRAAGVRWRQDVLRHTYATMRIAAGDAPGTVAADMGTSESMIWRHYRGLARRAEAAVFWAG
jgi:integrase